MSETAIGPYTLVQRIATGGMGTVYRAVHNALNREVALKILLPSLNEDERLVARFKREARSASALCHPNIIEINDLGVSGGEHYMSMEYVAGGSLQDLLRKGGPLEERQALQYARQIANALHYAHERGLVHRDVKPSNVLLRGDGTCVLADFGIVLATNGTKLTQTVSALGTPDYMSPEQVLGRKLDGRSDIYGLGMMLYEMLTGKPPFRGAPGESSVALINKHLNTPLPNIQRARKGISRSTRRIIERACAKKPSDRFATAERMSLAIDHALGERNMSAIQRIAVMFGLAKPASDSAAGRLVWALGGLALRFLTMMAVMAVLVVLVVGGLLTFAASIGLERFIGNGTWNLRAGMVGDQSIRVEDLRVQLKSMVSTYSLGFAQFRDLQVAPPDLIKATLNIEPSDFVFALRLHEVNGAPHVELLSVNGYSIPILAPALARGVNRGLLRAWRNERVVLRQFVFQDGLFRMRAEIVTGPLPDVIEMDSNTAFFGGIDVTLVSTVGLALFGLILLWLIGRWIASRTRRMRQQLRSQEEVENYDGRESETEPIQRFQTARFNQPEISPLTQRFRPGCALLEIADGDMMGRKFALGTQGHEVVWVGSDPQSDAAHIHIDQPGISKKHALIEWRDGKLWLMDAGTQGGTSVNKVKVTSKTPLKVGDTVAFAAVSAHLRPIA